MINHQSISNNRWLPLFLITLICLIFYGPNLFAWWGLIDDHEIIKYLGPDQNLSFGEFFRTLNDTEIFLFGDTLRYRPSYYFLRCVETLVWGPNITMWYLFRIVTYIYFSYLIFKTFNLFLTRFESLIFLLLMMNFYFWSDIISRLGPAEFYAILGLALIIQSFLVLLRKSNSLPALAAMVIGSIICIGTKENFIFTPVLIGYLFYILREIKNYKIQKINWVALLIIAAFTLFVVMGFLPSVLNQKVDIYQNSTRINPVVLIFQIIQSKHLIFTLISLIVFRCSKLFTKEFYFSGFMLMFFVLFQALFYRSSAATSMRYDYPVFVIIFFVYVLIYKSAQPLFEKKKLWYFVYIILFSLTFFKYLRPLKVIKTSSLNFSKTREFKKILDVALDKRNSEIVLEFGNSLSQYEPVISMAIFLRNFGYQGRIYLEKGQPERPETKDPLSLTLMKSLISTRINGDKFIDQYDIPSRENCLSILMGTKAPIACNSVVKSNF